MPERRFCVDTLPRIPTDVRSFEVRCKIGQFVMDGTDPDRAPDLAAIGGTVTIEPDLRRPVRITGDTPLDTRVAGVNGLEFQIDPATGRLIHPDGMPGVELIDPTDEHLDPQGWTYTATVRPNVGRSWSVTFGTPVDGTRIVNIGSLAGVDISPGTGGDPVQQAVAARDETRTLVTDAEGSVAAAQAHAVAAGESATYAATIAYGQPLEVTDTVMASVAGNESSALREALNHAYRTYVSVTDHGATGDGQTDDTAAVAAALTAGAGGLVYFPPGHYRLTENFDVPANTTISGAGSSSTLLDWSTKLEFQSTRQFLYWQPGTFTDQTALTVAANPGDVTIEVSAGHTFTAGDDVRIRADNLLWGEASPAEYQRILEVEGNTLHLGGPVFDTYALDQNATIEKAILPSGGIDSLSIRGKGINPAPSGYGDTAIRAGLVRDFIVRDVHFTDVENKCILLNSVLGASITDCHFRFDPTFTPLQYGVGITGGCQMITMRGCASWNDRHMITTSTSAARVDEYRGIPRLLTITGCTAYGSWQAPIDTHRGGEYITITGNALTSESIGIKIRNAKAIVVGNSIVGKQTSRGGASRGIWVGLVAQDVRVTGNMVHGFADGVRVEMQGTIDAAMRHVAVTDNSIVGCQNGVRLGQTVAINDVQISGNTITSPDGGYGVFFFAPATDIEVNGNTIVGGHTAIWMSHPTNPLVRAAIQGNVMRGQSSYGAYLRNTTDVWVMGNTSRGELRFTDTAVNVTTVMNNASIRDLTTGETVIQK